MSPHLVHGLRNIGGAFENSRKFRKAALMPYFTLGYPTVDESMEIVLSIAENSDLLELGIPFSDPIADGPTIQKSTQRALDNGISVVKCLDIVEQIRARAVYTPILLMSYYNPILAYGESRFVLDAIRVGADGLIIPDLPPEESVELDNLCQEVGLAFIYFLAPTSNHKRINLVTRRANGFVYMVSVSGVTGARTSLDPGLPDFVSKIRSQTDIPVAVGFGVSTAEQAAAISAFADGVIVGSALINAVEESDDKPTAASDLVRELSQALSI